MAPPPSALESALAALADRSPAELSRVPTLRAAHAACAAAGVFDGGAASASASAAAHAASAAGDGAVDVAKLHQIFDAAVHHGMPQLVCHYVDEVCGHDDFSSPDGVEAYLQDGEMVAEWAVAALASAAVALEQAAALRVPSAAADVDRAGAVFEALRDVLCALGASPSAGGERGAGTGGSAIASGAPGSGSDGFQSRLQSALDDATRRAQHARALAWALREGLCGASVSDRHGGPAAWAGSVAARRASAAAAAAAANLPETVDAGALFLDDLLAGVGDRPPSYPFKSAAEAAERVFAEGSAAPAALIAKQCLFLYYLLDSGADPNAAPARFARVARMSPRLFAETRAAALLDDRERVEALDEACALVPRVAHPGLSARFVAALAARGRPGAALAATRARRPPRTRTDHAAEEDGDDAYVYDAYASEDTTSEDESSCAEAELGVAVRLECGLATEAFLSARDATASARPSRRDAVARALVSRLASHAAAAGALESLLELPFEDHLERAFVAWLEKHGGSTPGAPAHLAASYFLARGRAAEAAAATTRVPGGFASLPRDVAAALEAATRALPEATRRLKLDGAAAAAAAAAEGSSALARALTVEPAAPSDFARTPAGVALAKETAPSAGVLRAAEGSDGNVPFFAPPRGALGAFGAFGAFGVGVGSVARVAHAHANAKANAKANANANADATANATPASPSRGGGDAWTTLRFEDDENARDGDADVDGMDADGGDENGGDAAAETAAGRRARRGGVGGTRAAWRSGAYSPFGARRRRAPIAAVAAAATTTTPARRQWATPAKFGAAAARTPARSVGAAAAKTAEGAEGGAVGEGTPTVGTPVGTPAANTNTNTNTKTKTKTSTSCVVAVDPAAGTILTGATPVTTRRSARGRSAAATEGSLMFASPAANEEPPSTRRVTRSSARLAGKR